MNNKITFFPKDNEAIIFLHIPKTAGTSLHNLLVPHFYEQNICPERFNFLKQWDKKKLQQFLFFSGHFDRGSIEYIPQKKIVLTCFRKPEDRILSLYYFWKSHTLTAINDHHLIGPKIAKDCSLLEFLRSKECTIAGNIDNTMTRTLLGHLYVGENGEYLYPTDEVFDRVSEYINSLPVFGIMEYFSESCDKIFSFLGLNPPQNIPHERNSEIGYADPNLESVHKEIITSDIQAELDRLTEMDNRIYNYALTRFKLIKPINEVGQSYDVKKIISLSTLNAFMNYLDQGIELYNDTDIDLIRNTALILESVDSKKAHELIALANKLRPSGPFSQKKLEAHQQTLLTVS